MHLVLLLLILLQNVNHSQKEFIKHKFTDNLQNNLKNNDNFQEILQLVEQYKALDFCKNMAQEFASKAKQDLKIFDGSQYYQDLISILDYSLKRLF